MSIRGMLGSMLFLGVAIIAVAIFFFKGFTAAIWSGVGLFLIIIAGIALIFSSLYIRARGNLAYVKTGKGGLRVIKDHGSIVIGFLHEVIPVSLETMKIIVTRDKRDSLITLDKLRAEVVAEFYIRVKADEDGISTAARTLGDKISAAAGGRVKNVVELDGVSLLKAQESAITDLEREKLIDALRTVAAKSTLEDLNLKRGDFKDAVMSAVKDGLEQNGLELEDCTISALDQASKDIMDPNNTFDAQGLKNLQKTISEQSVAENKFKRDAELEIKQKDVKTRTAILSQEQELKFKEADQMREIRSYEAEQNKSASVAELQNEEDTGRRAIEKEKAIQLESVKSEEEVSTKQVGKEQAIETANVEKRKTVEVAEREKEIIIAIKNAEKAEAEQKRQEAEAGAEKARQDVKTVEIVETAERQKAKAIIDKQAEIERERQEEQMKADVQAYATAKEAEGRKLAAEADYEAKTKAADADLIEKTKRAEGEKAQQTVPVEVSARQVEVDRDRVETVLKPELEAKAEHEKVSIDLKLGELEIEAKKEVGVAMAEAFGMMTSNADMTIFGDPETLAKMAERFQNGQGWAQTAEGFLKGTDGLKDLFSIFAPYAKKAGIDLGRIMGQTKDSDEAKDKE